MTLKKLLSLGLAMMVSMTTAACHEPADLPGGSATPPVQNAKVQGSSLSVQAPNVATPRRILSQLSLHGELTAVDLSGDGNFAAASYDGGVALGSVDINGQSHQSGVYGPLGSPIRAIKLARGRVFAASSTSDGAIFGTSGGKVWTTQDEPNTEGASIAIREEAHLAAFAVFGVSIFDYSLGRRVATLSEPSSSGGRTTYDAAAFQKDGSFVAASVDGVDVWKYRAGQWSYGRTSACSCRANSATLSANGEIAAFGTDNGRLVVLRVDTGEILLNQMVSPNQIVWGVALSMDGKQAAGGAVDRQLMVLDVARKTVSYRSHFEKFWAKELKFVDGDQKLLVNEQVDGLGTSGWHIRSWLLSIV